jgi:hypothetical protein
MATGGTPRFTWLKTWGAIGELGEQAMLAELAEVVR